VGIPGHLRSLSVPARVALLVALFALGGGIEARAEKRTVCTVTVNSADEREVFRQRLPEGEYEFVELVERGRPDWLASACRQGVRCDLLLISGNDTTPETAICMQLSLCGFNLFIKSRRCCSYR